MINSVQIKNYKSVVDLTLGLGTFNVLVGENGCGKSNILEAVAFGAAASADKLDFEFLGSRGVRATNPEFMYSAFKGELQKKRIEIYFQTDDKIFPDIEYIITNENDNTKKWINESRDILGRYIRERMARTLFDETVIDRKGKLKKFINEEESMKYFDDFANRISEEAIKRGKEEKKNDLFNFLYSQYLKDWYTNEIISNYVIYSPEQSSLRKFEETTQIYPLGIRGEGLFQHLKELSLDKKSKKLLSSIKDNLFLLDWYENFEMSDNLLQNEFSLKIKDKYLYEKLQYFDQRSTNEGFLFLLFYSTLFISKATPAFFAIDNIDASLNPKLCMELTRNLSGLAKKHKKQVVVTTQNPAILDGLNLKDDNQRLFVISRNEEGHTRAERIKYDERRTMKLSEVWTKGFIGGLPSNF